MDMLGTSLAFLEVSNALFWLKLPKFLSLLPCLFLALAQSGWQLMAEGNT